MYSLNEATDSSNPWNDVQDLSTKMRLSNLSIDCSNKTKILPPSPPPTPFTVLLCVSEVLTIY